MLEIALGVSHSGKAVLRLGEDFLAEIYRTSVVAAQDEESQHFAVVDFEQVSDGLEVSEGLGHLGSVNIYISVVHPVMGEFLAAVGFRLCYLVFVVRERRS